MHDGVPTSTESENPYIMPRNGNRPGEGAAYSVGKASNAAELTSHVNVTQAATPITEGVSSCVDTKTEADRAFGNDANGGIAVDTKSVDVEQFGNDGVGFIRVRKRKLKGGHPQWRAYHARTGTLTSSSMSFDLVRARRANGKPRHEFVLGLGSQKDADRDWALCWFWARAIKRMIRRGLAEDRRSRLVAEMVRKGARLPPVAECEKFVHCYSERGWNQPEVGELIHWLRKAEALPDPWPELPACLRRAAP